MNAPATPAPHRQAHPSPDRNRVSPWAVWFGILAAPVAWSIQQVTSPPIAAHGCYPHDVPLDAPIWSNLGTVIEIITIVAILIGIAGGLVAWRSWRRTRGERPGSGHHLIESGDGRSRFMAMVAMISSGLFLLAMLFAAGMTFLLSPCYG